MSDLINESKKQAESSERKRISFDEIFMRTAILFSKRSTCCRLQTGCVMVRDNHVISTGYNGTVSGDEHCETYWRRLYREKYVNQPVNQQNDNKCGNDEHTKNSYLTFEQFLESDEFKTQHHIFSTAKEIHAEENCLLRAAREDACMSTLYTVYSPCIHCAKTIVTLKVAKVIYLFEYRDLEGIRFCERNGVVVQHMVLNNSLVI